MHKFEDAIIGDSFYIIKDEVRPKPPRLVKMVIVEIRKQYGSYISAAPFPAGLS